MNEEEQLPPGVVPEGITLGDKVLVVPGLFFAGIFTHAGGVKPETSNRSYAWVKKDETIGTLWLHRRKSEIPVLGSFLGNESFSVKIKSPADGLILFPSYGVISTVEFKDSPPLATFSILLPDDEPDPTPGKTLFADAVDLIRENMDVLKRPSRYRTMMGQEPEEVERLLERQLAADPRSYPALPRWKGNLDDARTKYPSIRPYIKHLR